MEAHSSVKWSSAARNVIQQKLLDFEEAERIAKKSRLSIGDVDLIAFKISFKDEKHAEALLDEISHGR